jgi:two-component system response regulator PhcR
MHEHEHRAATILYVDDEEMARKYFVRAIGADYEVLTAAGVDAAIDILEEAHHRIDVLVTDFRMPGRDGGDLLRQVERRYPHIVRILLTAYADKDVLLETVNSGEIFRILEKPLDLMAVRSTLRQASELARERKARQQRLMAINETLAFLAHELNTPLASIVNFSRGIERRSGCDENPTRQQHEIGNAAGSIYNNARYCLSVLSTFVDSVRTVSTVPATGGGVTAHQLIMSLLDTYPMSPSQRASIQIDVRRDFRITALPNCVSLVLSSVLGNALRALHERQAPVLCFAVLVDVRPQIRISDNGPGISREIMERLLVDPVTTHQDAGGSGWGLIFCNRIMQSFGGGMRIHSEPGEHTTVTLEFPVIKDQVQRSDR